MENGQAGTQLAARPEEADDVAAEGAVLGVLEDDRFRATVTTTGSEVVVTLEGQLDEAAVPVVDELLDAVGRWPGRGERRRAVDGVDPADGTDADADPEVDSGAVLLLDTRHAELEPAGRRMLAGRRARWRREHGPCESLSEGSSQGSNR